MLVALLIYLLVHNSMTKSSPHQTHFTRQVRWLLSSIYGRGHGKISVLENAISYYKQSDFIASNESGDSAQNKLLHTQRIQSHAHLHAVCLEILTLTEGESFNDTNRKTAQFLGTIQLVTSTEGHKVSKENEQSKVLYKAVLALRLLDNLCSTATVKDPYIDNCLTDVQPHEIHQLSKQSDTHIGKEQHRYISQVKVSVLMAALLQDMGLYHPKAREMLLGLDGKDDPYRVLCEEDRTALFHINYRETCNYIVDGIGVGDYVGNSREDRDQYEVDEKERIDFIQNIIKLSMDPKQGIGNILKVPQIYTTIVFSTKSNYDYKLLPKVFHVLNKNVELGGCSKAVVTALYQITGMFPQGYGIVYMPEDELGGQADCYEYAIVNQLYPEHPQQPLCRMATRNLAFVGFGQDIEVKRSNNLYFPEMAKKMTSLSKERLNEILKLLSSNAKERQQLDLLPRCWHGNDFFSVKVNQKLWNKVD